jgi:hypothetical protein
MAYAFRPVGVFKSTEGFFLQFPRERGVPSPFQYRVDLGYLRSKLFCRAAGRLAGSDSPIAIGRMVFRPGVSIESARRRWAILSRYDDYYASADRKNGIVNACKRDIAGRCEFIDALIDDRAPIWVLAAGGDLSCVNVKQFRAQVARIGLIVPPPVNADLRGFAEWNPIADAIKARVTGPEGWMLANILFYCLKRAQSTGNAFEYSIAYSSMLRLMRDTTDILPATREHEHDRTFSEAWATSWAASVAPDTDTIPINAWLLADFWREFGRFLQDWYSRIRIFDRLFPDLKEAASSLDSRGLKVRWQVIEPEFPGMQITGLWSRLFRSPSPGRDEDEPYPRYPGNLIASSLQVKERKNLLRGTWLLIPARNRATN